MLSKERKESLQEVVDLQDPLNPQILPKNKHHFRRRLIIFIASVLFLGAAVFFLSDAFFNKDPGWRRIELRPGTISKAYNAQFVFHYDLGENENSLKSKYRKIQNLYTQALSDAKSLYSLKKLNSTPNEELKIPDVLYTALEKLANIGDRRIYLAPVYKLYEGVFNSNTDKAAAATDPYLNEEAYEGLNKLMVYAGSSEHIKLVFGLDNKITLQVSEDYLAYAKDKNITEFISFYWMENALIVDYVSDVMMENGYMQGKIASFDGYSKNLSLNEGYTQVIIMRIMDRVQGAGRYHAYKDGSVRHAYLDASNGLCCDIPKDLGMHEDGNSSACFDLLLELLPELSYSDTGRDGLHPAK